MIHASTLWRFFRVFQRTKIYRWFEWIFSSTGCFKFVATNRPAISGNVFYFDNDQRSNTFFLLHFHNSQQAVQLLKRSGCPFVEIVLDIRRWDFFLWHPANSMKKKFYFAYYNLFGCMFCSDFGTRNISAWVNNVAFT